MKAPYVNYVTMWLKKYHGDTSKGCPIFMNFQHPNWVSLKLQPRCLIGYGKEAFVVPET